MPCSVLFSSLRIEDLPELHQTNCLYSFDPRSILDECLGKHRYIVSCENMLCQTLLNQHIAVNQYAAKLPHPENNRLFIVPITGDPRPSLYERMSARLLPDEIERLYVCVPHPLADALARSLNLHLNYSFTDFATYNDKIAQKTILGDRTPNWEIIDPKTHVFDEKVDCYYKRDIGAGGYATFHSSNLEGLKLPSRKYPARWYTEETIEGEPCSIQIYKTLNNEFIVFGYSEMRIIERKNYAGGMMHRVSKITSEMRTQIQTALNRLTPLLWGYQGFLGLDFIRNGEDMMFLEANVRVTMATFATLELNASDQQETPFYRFR